MLAFCPFAGCSGKAVETAETRLAMDTSVTVRAVAPSEAVAKAAIAAAWKEMDECIFHLDNYRKPSEAWLKKDPKALADPAQQPSDVWRINDGAGKWGPSVSPVVTSCLGAAKEVWQLSGGAFDPTVGPILNLWRQAQEADRLPTDDQTQEARALVGMDKVEIMIAEVRKASEEMPIASPDRGEPPGPEELTKMMNVVTLRAGMKLDLGGIAKGYIAGRMAQRMKQAGALAGLVAAAGDVYAFGERPANLAKGGDRRWSVGVQDPRFPDDQTKLYTRIHLKDQAADTSGHYYRGYTVQGKRYSHIVDPRTGRPVDTRLASITVVAADPAFSDGLATAIAVVGVQKGMELVEKSPGTECLLLEVAPSDSPPQANGAPAAGPSPAVGLRPAGGSKLIAHRSKGFAALEFTPKE